MRIHHLNCMSLCPPGGPLVDPGSKSLSEHGHLVCHCLLIETTEGLVLVDTGLGLRDVTDAENRLSPAFLKLMRPEFQERMTAIRQIEGMGFKPADVRHILLTHLDCEQAGGLDDFPLATVHLMTRERESAELPRTWADRQRYRRRQWTRRNHWITYAQVGGEQWMGFDCVRGLQDLPEEILLVPLPGHTAGHAGVAVQSGGRWLLLAGDAYYHHGEMDPEQPYCPSGLWWYQRTFAVDRDARIDTLERLRDLQFQRADKVEVFCSHDASEFERLAGRAARMPAPPLNVVPIRDRRTHQRWEGGPDYIVGAIRRERAAGGTAGYAAGP